MGSVIQAGFGYIESRQVKQAKDFEAMQLQRAAIARKAAGTQDAYEQRKIGEKIESNAIAAMAASGGVVESDIVADLKATTDYNVLSTLFASKEESNQLTLQARLKSYEGKQAKRMGTAKLATALISEGVQAGMSAASSPSTSTVTSTTQSGIVSPGAGIDTYANSGRYAGYA